MAEDPEATPRPSSPNKRRRLNVSSELALRQPPFSDVASSTDELGSVAEDLRSQTGSIMTEDTAGDNSKRSRSPVKNMADLRLAEKPVETVLLRTKEQLPRDVELLFRRSKEIRAGHDIVPRDVEEAITAALTLADDPISSGSIYDTHEWSTQHSLAVWDSSEELRTLRRIVDRTAVCSLENVSEAAWNTRVHDLILDIALEPYGDHVSHWDVTRALINKPYLTKHGTGPSLQAKMVDFCIALGGTEITIPVRQKLKTCKDYHSINHTSYQALRDRPIGVSIETKTPEGSDQQAKAQLSVWSTSHLKRLRTLAVMVGTNEVLDLTLPVVTVYGSEWNLYFIRDCDDKVELIEAISIGNTKSLVGCYKVVAFIRELANWTIQVYEPWLRRKIF